jgi:DNA-binding NarL/FixJ family response regulator
MPLEKPIRILLVDNHALVRAGLRRLIESEPQFALVGEAGDQPRALELAAQLQPDIILLEPNVSADCGLDVIPQLLNAAREASILLVTGIADLQTHRLAIQLGALGIVKKQEPYEVLAKAIRKVYAGEAWIDRSMVAGIISTFSRGSEPNPETERVALLSERECQVISSLGRGLKNREIAEHLCISDTTVRHHLTAIFSKLQVADRLELLVFAYRNGLVEQSR